MNPRKKGNRLPASIGKDDLLRLELRVAKRADMLWRRAGRCSGRDLVHWLQAESEVFERYFRLEQPTGVLVAAEQ